MRKPFWIVLALLVVGSAPVAHADSFTYTYTELDFYSWTTAAIPAAVTMATTVPAADLTATSLLSASLARCTITSVVLDDGGVGSTTTNLNFPTCTTISSITNGDNFALTDYSTLGTYNGLIGDTLVVTAVTTTPEPSSVALMLFGVGILFVTRKRMGHSRPSTV